MPLTRAIGTDDPGYQLSKDEWNALVDVAEVAIARTASRTTLVAIDASLHPVVFLFEAGREGTFVWDATVPVATHQADTQQGIYVAPNSAAAGAWVRRYQGAVNAKWFGLDGTGVPSDVLAFNGWISYLNSLGSAARSEYKVVHGFVPAGEYNIKAGGMTAILISNLHIQLDEAATFVLRDGAPWNLGNSTTFIENIWLYGGQPVTETADALTENMSWVNGINCARVFVSPSHFYRIAHLYKGVSAYTQSGIYLDWRHGVGSPDHSLVKIDNSANPSAIGAGLYLIDGQAYPYAPPANPSLLPKPVTNITQANPGVVTVEGHGYTTGDRVRLGGVGGMTQVNGQDFTITSIDANSFSLGVDTTTYGAYTSGGWAVELHWSWQHSAAVVEIIGHWDTARIQGGLYQHYKWLWNLDARGIISFVYDESVEFDYGGSGRFKIALNGGSVTNHKLTGGRTFCLNGDWIEISNSTGNFITDMEVIDHKFAMIGKSIINDNAASRIINLNVDNCRIDIVGRARIGTAYDVFGGINAIWHIDKLIHNDPVINYGASASTYFLPDIGIKLLAGTTYEVRNCTIYALGQHYDIPLTDASGDRKRLLSGNKKFNGTLPEYLTTAAASISASGATVTNHTGATIIDHITNTSGITAIWKDGLQIGTSAPPLLTIKLEPGKSYRLDYTTPPTLVREFADC